ncbi:hypothetical protein AXG93_154s1470 [Marchantia polymorpha subsp. ruderalis]|uniref:Uncharacterized protein n=1 Tax=Marchantia polymorpha subsp. ruderalis TaxID=1480154 RepID=A0A176VJT6_MARPO|nr:hypothetical protein AXG93_154s1470 [Marchantia polymorpha subsp. ruderalis]
MEVKCGAVRWGMRCDAMRCRTRDSARDGTEGRTLGFGNFGVRSRPREDDATGVGRRRRVLIRGSPVELNGKIYYGGGGCRQGQASADGGAGEEPQAEAEEAGTRKLDVAAAAVYYGNTLRPGKQWPGTTSADGSGSAATAVVTRVVTFGQSPSHVNMAGALTERAGREKKSQRFDRVRVLALARDRRNETGADAQLSRTRAGRKDEGTESRAQERRKGRQDKGRERKGKERKGKERKGKERKGKERKGKERKGKERKEGMDGKVEEMKGKESRA